MIKLFVSQLEKQQIELDGELDASFLPVEKNQLFELIDPITYSLKAKLLNSGALLTGEISVNIKTSCGRCLKDFEQQISTGKFTRLYKNEDISKGEIILDDDIREEMILALPINCICRDDCRGLCHNCGVDLNVESCDCDTTEPDDDIENFWSALDQL